MTTYDILDRLISFDTTSRNPNIELMIYVQELLDSAGIASQLIHDDTGSKANLYATIGPADSGGVLLSGHTDVVPVDGQDWTLPPFRMTKRDGRLYGRGSTDMKGFVAAALAMAIRAAERDLKTPLHLAFSHDEEIGCVGVHSLIDMLKAAPFRPKFCIIGEPTQMAVATGHKGKTAIEVTCRGLEGHSALAPFAVNAIYLAHDVITAIRDKQAELVALGASDGDYDVPYTTLHTGRIAAGGALNIVPNHCRFAWEIRNIAADDPLVILDDIKAAAARITARARDIAPDADISFDIINTYPGLDTAPDAAVVDFVKGLTGANGTIKVAFGTEGGLFSERLGIPSVVCGPGSMAQGHKPDEFITMDQLAACDAMLSRLLDHLEAGI